MVNLISTDVEQTNYPSPNPLQTLVAEESHLIRTLYIRKFSTVASLVVLIYESVSMSQDEMLYIWGNPLTGVRLTYIFSRYLGLVSRIVNTYFVFGPFSRTDIARETCESWFAVQLIVACCLLAALDGILMLRVYALHRKSRLVGMLLGLLFGGQTFMDVVFGREAIREVPYDGICDIQKTHPDVFYLGASVLVVHGGMAVLTLLKRDLMKLGAPVVRLVARDGAWMFAIVCAMYVAIVPHAVITKVAQEHIIFGWPSTITSICCCRVIMNFQTLEIDNTERDAESGPELSGLTFELQIE